MDAMNTMKNDQIIQDLTRRKKVFGSIGALDFLLAFENKKNKRNKRNKRNKINFTPSIAEVKECSFEGKDELLRFCDVSLPLFTDFPTYEKLNANGVVYKKDLLFKASDISIKKGDAEALSYIENIVSAHDYPEINLLRANASCSDVEWLSFLNSYLKKHSISDIELLAGDDDRFYRLHSKHKRSVYSGPKVSILMPAYNAERTIKFSANSILNQSWKNLELIIIDDCSTDNTWAELIKIKNKDDRVKIIKNPYNLGPYVSKNRALDVAVGEYITGHDADDWAHPERIEKQVCYLISNNWLAGVGHMLRISEQGRFTSLGKRNDFSPDGAIRKSLISTIFETRFLKENLGYWDCVRFGADSEMANRASIVLGQKLPEMPICTMICLDLETSLTNHPEFGLKKNASNDPRIQYKKSWLEWHKSLDEASSYLGFGEGRSYFTVPDASFIDDALINKIK